jgi:AraC-like DNA-binding protein
LAGNTVSAAYAKSLVEVAVAHGADTKALLARAGIDPARLENLDTRLPFERFKVLMRAAKTLLNDPAFALAFGAESRFYDLSIVGLVLRASETMGTAFVEMNRYARLVVEVDGHETGDRFAILREKSKIWLEDRRRNPNDFPELTESTWTRFISDTARAFPGAAFAKAAYLPHSEPAWRGEYERRWKVPVFFESDRNALLIDESWLSLKINTENRYVFGVFSERAQALLQELKNSKSMKGRIESLLIPTLHTGELGMSDIARKLALSRPTLYRKLKDEGTNYDALLDDLRCRMALNYLSGGKASVSQVAYLTGFSDASTFSRAFKRWTGKRPGASRASTARPPSS